MKSSSGVCRVVSVVVAIAPLMTPLTASSATEVAALKHQPTPTSIMTASLAAPARAMPMQATFTGDVIYRSPASSVVRVSSAEPVVAVPRRHDAWFTLLMLVGLVFLQLRRKHKSIPHQSLSMRSEPLASPASRPVASRPLGLRHVEDAV